MPRRNQSGVACAICGAALHSEALFDEHTENYFCDRLCFDEWADHTQKHLEYYAKYNLREVDL